MDYNKYFTLTKDSSESEYLRVFDLDIDEIVFIPEDEETIFERINYYMDYYGGTFELTSINPGTELFAMTGPNHYLVTKNTFLTE